jgi:hypothetical protein
MPSITTWNRIEPRARSTDLAEGLAARVHDPLWFLLRQWQVGEFEGRDAGSPVMATVATSSAAFDRCAIGTQTSAAYDGRTPIEVLVEREPARPASSAGDVRQAAEAGLYFLRLLGAAQLPATIAAAYLAAYPLAPESGDAGDISSVVAGRVIDGIKLYGDLKAAGSTLPAQPVIPDASQAAVLSVTRTWLAWYNSLFSEPVATDGWSADRLEYAFALAAAGSTTPYAAQEYDGGFVDWYTFDRSPNAIAAGTASPSAATKSVVVAPVTFRGMPGRRFWELEDASVDIGALSAAAEDVGRLLLRDFALIYGNDWFAFPLAAAVGSQIEITSLSVADTFGVATQIPHYAAVDGAAAGWRVFALSGEPALPNQIIIPPSAATSVDGAAIEDVLLLRDELAAMAWGIERTICGPSGQPYDRATAWNISLPVVPPPSANAMPQYRLGSNVPDFWIPFLPVPAGSNGTVKLVRGKLPTSATGALSRILTDATAGFFIEEVPREGVQAERLYRCARGSDGAAYLWLSRRRSIGQGEGRSGLTFDFLA